LDPTKSQHDQSLGDRLLARATMDHDYLWRCMKCLPNRGHIGIFNRSYYEEVLVVRVHPEFLAKQKLVPLSTVSVQPAQIGNNTVTNVFT